MTDQELFDAQTAARELMAEAAEAERLRAEVRLLRQSVADHRLALRTRYAEGVRAGLELALRRTMTQSPSVIMDTLRQEIVALNLNPPLCGCRLPADVCDGSWPACRAPTPASPEETER